MILSTEPSKAFNAFKFLIYFPFSTKLAVGNYGFGIEEQKIYLKICAAFAQ